MGNNEVFKYLLHLTGIGKDKLLIEEIFLLGGIKATHSKIKGWRTSLDNPRASHMPDNVLKAFFTGLFEYRDLKNTQGVAVFNFLQNP